MLRILSPLEADGTVQMAFDEALLETAGNPTLRLYTWDPPTVSLGYFQAHDPIVAQLPRGMPVVRRITGGGAIWHQHEVTYCLVGTLGHDFYAGQRQGNRGYPRFTDPELRGEEGYKSYLRMACEKSLERAGEKRRPSRT